jgi:hypothetical protein
MLSAKSNRHHIFKKRIRSICDLVLEENARRSEKEKKVFIMYDQMYWHLTYGISNIIILFH